MSDGEPLKARELSIMQPLTDEEVAEAQADSKMLAEMAAEHARRVNEMFLDQVKAHDEEAVRAIAPLSTPTAEGILSDMRAHYRATRRLMGEGAEICALPPDDYAEVLLAMRSRFGTEDDPAGGTEPMRPKYFGMTLLEDEDVEPGRALLCATFGHYRAWKRAKLHERMGHDAAERAYEKWLGKGD